mgnify:CR=1 FL=1
MPIIGKKPCPTILFCHLVFTAVRQLDSSTARQLDSSTARQVRSVPLLAVFLSALLWVSVASSYAAPAPESKLPASGRVVVSGSGPLVNLISLWPMTSPAFPPNECASNHLFAGSGYRIYFAEKRWSNCDQLLAGGDKSSQQ